MSHIHNMHHMHQRGQTSQSWTGFLFLILSLLLFVLPLPQWLLVLTPFWSILVFYYWVVGLRTPWACLWILSVGLILDWLDSSVLGMHVFALTLSLWLPFADRRLITHASMDRQVLWLLIACLCYQSVLIFLHCAFVSAVHWEVWVHLIIRALISAMCWPWFYTFLTQSLNLPAFSRKKVIR